MLGAVEPRVRPNGQRKYFCDIISKKRAKTYKLSTMDEVVIRRLRLGHTRVAQGQIFDCESRFERQPMCHWCEVQLLRIMPGLH